MPTWKLSRYSVVFRTETGDVLLHNSYMGAVARISAAAFEPIEKVLRQEITEEQLENESLKELCDNGFFFPTHIDEQQFVVDVLDRENNTGDFDLIILPHEGCNFRCDYCYETHKRGMIEPKVVTGLKLFVAQKAAECKSLCVRWFGGEPLLAKDIIYELSDSFMHSCAENDIHYWGQMTTNGYLLTPDVAQALLKHRVANYQITLDGPETAHDTTRKLAGGGKTYRTILDNLLGMKKIDSHFSVSIRVNFNNDSLPMMDGFFESMSRLFGDDPRFALYFRPVGKYGGPNDENIDVCEPSYAKLIEMELTEKYLQYGHLDKLVRKSLQSHGHVCYAGKGASMIVGADGTIYKCSVAFENPQNHVGELMADGNPQIDQLLWDLWVNNKDTVHGKCVSCPIVPLCQGKYCPRYTIREKKPICPMKPEEYMALVQLASSRDYRLL